MRLKPTIGLPPILAIGLFMSFTAMGQNWPDGATMQVETTPKEAPITPEPDESEVAKPIAKPTTTLRDSVSHIKVAKPVLKTTPEKTPAPEDPLSFNFLYYIIEKFKMSDMTE